MKELNRVNILNASVKKEDNILTILKGKFAITPRDQIQDGENTIIAYTVDRNKNGTYDNYYLVLSPEGEILAEYMEDDGILPTLFQGPGNEIWVAVTVYHRIKNLKNGWFTIRKEKLIECWYSKKEKGYRNLLEPTQLINLPYDDFVISGLSATRENAYALTLNSYNKKRQNELFILNRQTQFK